ncbi:hypothetical protein [Tepidimicrobium xylanilyticum]|uniref:Uncharacterized protein n=1 Tax=Tepidimicrobium xylanilyticum TaxID=1123352 RepID=A0A1H2TMI7_9FIRM|nr:hypothetical protein [Tepidimicrobium xylanilyticum]GMG95907.1 hypothetical protein EN5CB1_07330 [Tepidimicrobium xylanilyticum]SDW44997.1 hypothetical protein SAMN05660923_00753 [Tepidimicrobium xylanilyticum]
MKEEKYKRRNDENFFNQMNYEIAAEHGIIDNEDMKRNEKLINWNKKKKVNNENPSS